MSKNNELKITEIIESSEGKDALDTFGRAYASSGDMRIAIESGIERAKELGIWTPFLAAMTSDTITKIGPILYKYRTKYLNDSKK